MTERKIKINDKLTRNFAIEVKTVDKENGTLEAIFSTQDEDRHGDVVMQDGWDLKNFKKNPVILNSHNYGDATEVIGKASNVRVEGKKLVATVTFAVAENPKAKVIFDLFANGFLNAFSVGFMVKKFKEDKDGTVNWFVIEEAELLEVSAVSVPANARALAKQKGIDVDALGDDDEITPPVEVPTVDEPINPDPTGDDDEEDEEDLDDVETDAVEAPKEEPIVEPETPEEVPPAPVVQTSYKAKVVVAIHSIKRQERIALKKAHAIIQGILDGDGEAKHQDQKVAEQVRKRKVNQAIRALIEAK